MSDPQQTIRRILVALDESRHGESALAAAAELAKRMQAELAGLFVEDINLIQLAELPFTREVTAASSSPRPLEPETVERSLRAKAEAVRHLFNQAAHRAHVHCTFEITRGHIIPTALNAAREVEVVVMGHGKRPPRAVDVSGEKSGKSLPLIPEHAVAIVCDGSPASYRALTIAAQLSQSLQRRLILLCLGELDQTKPIFDDANEWLQERQLPTAVTGIPVSDAHAVATLPEQLGCAAVVINQTYERLPNETIDTVIRELDCPVVLVK